MKGKKNNKSVISWIIIILLIIIIIILLFLNRFGQIEYNNCPTPTGNIDVFNIDINCNCEESGKCDNNGSKDNKKDKEVISLPMWNDEDEEENELDKVYVDDKSGNYIYHQNLNIFENPFYEFTTKIAPGVHNSYSFVVHNNSDMNIRYYIEMYKVCDYDLDLKYRLKRNGEYVLGDDSKWVSASELKTMFTKLDSKENDKYILEWKWEFEAGRDDVDTYIGKNMKDVYKLNTKFYIEQV